MKGSQHLISRANDPKDRERQTILGRIIYRISPMLITVNDLTAESGEMMLREYVTNQDLGFPVPSPGLIATEKYIEEIVLPSIEQFKEGKRHIERIKQILLDAGKRHGRRYRAPDGSY
jgi:hypothetical protein